MNTTKKNGRPTHKFLQVKIPSDVLTDLKVYCAQSDQRLKDIVAQALRAFLK